MRLIVLEMLRSILIDCLNMCLSSEALIERGLLQRTESQSKEPNGYNKFIFLMLVVQTVPQAKCLLC